MHHAVIFIFVGAVYSILFIFQFFCDGDFIFADSIAAVVLDVLSSLKVLTLHTCFFNGAGVRAGGAFLTGGSIGAGLGALTDSTLAVTPAAAQHADAGHAGVYDRAAVTVFTFPAGVTLAEPTAALSMIGTESPFEAQAVEVVTLAVFSPHLTKIICMAGALST